MNTRKYVRCTQCGSLERTRAMYLFIEKYNLVKPGYRILHFAPEWGLAQKLRNLVGDGYEPCDLDTDRYKHIGVRKVNLVEDAAKFPPNSYDLIIHNHVIEHLPCNYTAILFFLHRSLKNTGVHLFSIPILSGYDEESLFPLTEEERHRRFGQFDHVRRFGRESLNNTLGLVFRMPDYYDLEQKFGASICELHNIPVDARKGFTGHTIFMFRKNDIRLNAKECK
ncbi:methyltransferase domain-containing protein [Limnospira indica]|nr:methyltransferase domain-containing protein [Limnospira indica]